MDPQAPVFQPTPPPSSAKPVFPLKTILITAVAVLLIAGLGIGSYLLFSDKESAAYKAIFGIAGSAESDADQGDYSESDGEGDDQNDQNNQDNGNGEDDPYAGWETFTASECDVTFKYPSDWRVNAITGAEYGDVTVSSGNYVWNLYYDPFVTGGGFGYMMGEPVPASIATNSTVTPDLYTATMVTQYISRSDLVSAYDASIVSTFNIGEDTWEGSVLFSDAAARELGFGPGEMYTNTKCDWFGISYLYKSLLNDYSDLPRKSNATLDTMLTTMDLITNSVEL